MRRAPRLFSSSMTAAQRRVYRIVTCLFFGIFLATIWPVYPRFGGIHPMILGIPLSLFYVVALVALSFLAILALYMWEGRELDGPGEGED